MCPPYVNNYKEWIPLEPGYTSNTMTLLASYESVMCAYNLWLPPSNKKKITGLFQTTNAKVISITLLPPVRTNYTMSMVVRIIKLTGFK